MAKEVTEVNFGNQWRLHEKGYFTREEIYGKSEEEELEEFEKIFSIQGTNLDGKRILDAGCGSGRLTASIGSKYKKARVVGIDISDSVNLARKRARSLKNVQIVKGDLNKYSFKKASFDYIWCEGVLHHTSNPKESFESLGKLLKKGGKMYVWVYPSYLTTPYVIIRKLFWRSCSYPEFLNYGLSWFLAPALYLVYSLAKAFSLIDRSYSVGSLAFKIHDTLIPEYQSYHSKSEVAGWYKNCGMRDVKIVRDLGIVGIKA